MDGMEEISFQIISSVGVARSLLMEALQLSRKGEQQLTEEKLKEANEAILQAHKEHFQLIQQEANGKPVEFSLLFMHAEDQLMGVSQFKEIVSEFMQVYEDLNELKRS